MDDDMREVCEYARLMIHGLEKFDLEGQDYATVATMYMVRDRLRDALDRCEEKV